MWNNTSYCFFNSFSMTLLSWRRRIYRRLIRISSSTSTWRSISSIKRSWCVSSGRMSKSASIRSFWYTIVSYRWWWCSSCISWISVKRTIIIMSSSRHSCISTVWTYSTRTSSRFYKTYWIVIEFYNISRFNIIYWWYSCSSIWCKIMISTKPCRVWYTSFWAPTSNIYSTVWHTSFIWFSSRWSSSKIWISIIRSYCSRWKWNHLLILHPYSISSGRCFFSLSSICTVKSISTLLSFTI